MLYHVNITLKTGGREIELGHTESELQDRVLGPYEMARPFMVNGKTIEPGNIHKLRISRGETTVADLLAEAAEEGHRKGIIGFDSYFAWSTCEEVTDDIVLGPPGYKIPSAKVTRGKTGRGHKLGLFVVHGDDQGLKNAVARFAEAVGLKPVTLHDRPDRGRTVIERFEQESDLGFAIMLCAADDLAGSRSALGQAGSTIEKEALRQRARQNVIFELGYFVGKLGRSRVAIIMDEGVEFPLGLHAIIYISRDNWTTELHRALIDAGYSISQEQSRKALAIQD